MSNIARVAGQAANTLVKPLNVEDVFSTYLYEGNGSTQAITNDIDLDGEGGLVWIKNRDYTSDHVLYDTERGVSTKLVTNSTAAEVFASGQGITSFNTDGFTISTGDNDYNSLSSYASWTFRKAPKFFDVVTWTGDGTGTRDIPHNLGTTVGMIVMKQTQSTLYDWFVYHRGYTSNTGRLNSTDAFNTSSLILRPTPSQETTHFQVSGTYNGSGQTHVAYLFAHNDGDASFGPDGDADIIKCGSYTATNNDSTAPEINLGFEPQYLLVKNVSSAHNWYVLDTMRGIPSGGTYSYLNPNLSSAEATSSPSTKLTATGFIPQNRLNFGNTNTYIYIAIRRGPMAVPTDATDVFAIDTKNSSGDNTDPTWDLGIVTDMAIQKFNKTTATTPLITSRLTGTQYLKTSETDAETSNSGMNYDHMTGVGTGNGSTTDVNDIVWGWKRAPNYFDVVAYTGNGTAGRTVSHNLGVAPEMMWVKDRWSSTFWRCYHSGIDVNGDNAPETDYISINSTAAAFDAPDFWNDTAPTDTVFTLGSGNDVNRSGNAFIAYLFASLAGVSKVGSYTGNGSSQTIDCGFSSGARFVLIKRTDNISSWFVFDTTRGIVSGNDKLLFLDTQAAEETAYDNIDPDSSGFIINNTGWGENASGGSYIFYAIA